MQIRTDLAMEAANAQGSLAGVEVKQWEREGVTVTEVQITTQEAAKTLNKPMGKYLTLESEGMKNRSPETQQALTLLLAEEIERLLPPDEVNAPVLIIGLGNKAVTPDSLGPKAADRVLVTRHLPAAKGFENIPFTPVCAIAPGVLGTTGLETMETVFSLVKEIKPRCVICVDSLAARESGHIGTSVQITDTGIQPGSGVGNHRRQLTRETLGVNVIAIGVPTVVYAATIARDALSLLGNAPETDDTVNRVTERLFENEIGEMIVTPREVDDMIADAAAIVAGGINRALQNRLSATEIQNLGGA